ncbi:MAG: LptE family protein [Bacteroidia bacterium]|nr:LptE family protein [Bacteroidia bacterium]|tara:strand:+ start:28 stop:543 length:516 start_codon:yes stop_codon:yes gene_type:complete
MKLKVNTFILSAMILASIVLQSCGFYSFSGTSIPQEVKTFSVSYFDNNAPINSPLLSQTITEGLKQKFISETNLSIEERNGDFEFSGEITSFTVTPVSAQSTDNAQLNRLTIQVAVKLVCASDDKISFEQTFSNFQDFDATLNFSDVENDLVEEISEMLIQSIFNKAAINW